jgi:hypothetical protein
VSAVQGLQALKIAAFEGSRFKRSRKKELLEFPDFREVRESGWQIQSPATIKKALLASDLGLRLSLLRNSAFAHDFIEQCF